MEKTLALLSLISHQRHDFLNCLQVIQGYWQLDKPDRAKACMDDFVRQMRSYSCLQELADPELLLAILVGIQQTPEVQLEIQPLPPAKSLGTEAAEALGQLWSSMPNSKLIFQAEPQSNWIVFTWLTPDSEIKAAEQLNILADYLEPEGGKISLAKSVVQIFWPAETQRGADNVF